MIVTVSINANRPTSATTVPSSVPAVTLDLNTFGQRVLRILRDHPSRLTFSGDVILYVGKLFADQDPLSEESPTITQAIVDGWSSTEIHAIIRDCSQRLRLDRWQAQRRETAVQCSTMIDVAIEPIRSFEPGEAQAKLLALAVKRLRVDVREMLEAGYSVSHIARELGLDRSTLAHTLLDIRAHAS